MFDINNYDKEEYNKERQERLRKKENEQENSNPHNNHNDENQFDYYKKNKVVSSRPKRGVWALALLGIVGVVGYLGFNSLGGDSSKELPKEVKSTIVEQSKELTPSKEGVTETIALNSSVSQEKKIEVSNQEKVVETIALNSSVSQEKKIEVSSEEIESPPTSTAVINKSKTIEVTNSNNIEKELKTETVEKKVDTPKPKKIEKKRVVKKVVKKEKRVVTIEKRKRRMVTVRKGDTLASISKRFYGNSMKFDKIIKANRRIKSKSTSLRLGEKLLVPRVNKSRERRMITIRAGDTLAIIAKEFYGDSRKYQRIIKANYRIKSTATSLHIGQKIHVPR